MFGYNLIKKERLKELEDLENRLNNLERYHWWFSGWPHVLSLLDKFIKGEVKASTINQIRDDFAKAMNTDVYGKEKNEISADI